MSLGIYGRPNLISITRLNNKRYIDTSKTGFVSARHYP